MSIVYSADLFCNARNKGGQLCGTWTHGTTQRHHPPTKKRTRQAVDDRMDPDVGWTHKGGLDFCPDHSAKQKDEA